MARQDSNWHIFDERINGIESQVSDMSVQLTSTSTHVEALQEDIGGLVKSFNEYVTDQNKSNKTDWATIAAYATLIFAAVGGMLYHTSLTLEPLKVVNHYQEQRISQLEKNAETNPAIQGY